MCISDTLASAQWLFRFYRFIFSLRGREGPAISFYYFFALLWAFFYQGSLLRHKFPERRAWSCSLHRGEEPPRNGSLWNVPVMFFIFYYPISTFRLHNTHEFKLWCIHIYIHTYICTNIYIHIHIHIDGFLLASSMLIIESVRTFEFGRQYWTTFNPNQYFRSIRISLQY